MILYVLLFAILGYLAVKLPIAIFSYTPWLRHHRHRFKLLLGTIGVLFSGVVILIAHTS